MDGLTQPWMDCCVCQKVVVYKLSPLLFSVITELVAIVLVFNFLNYNFGLCGYGSLKVALHFNKINNVYEDSILHSLSL